ncbi:hypothetical protein K5X82_12220 [Halosquirtibacter xylanolyticus]|uniref:hypothetical protein n=1 Tax=Halosquirtibacter xylanolyticus TaxID=3374599 RepID=UPI00374905BA|nr:hypothetical protein K5X82_12220 [Prolixibacteraceae bacterium]
MKHLTFIIALLLCINAFSRNTKNIDKLSTSDVSATNDKKKMHRFLSINEYSNAREAYLKLRDNKHSNSVMTYSEWIYCSIIFGDKERFLELIRLNYYPSSTNTTKGKQSKYHNINTHLIQYYQSYWDEIRERSKVDKSMTQEQINMYTYFYMATCKNQSENVRIKTSDALKAYIKSNSASENIYFIEWLQGEMVRESEEDFQKGKRRDKMILLEVGGFNSKGGAGIYISGADVYDNFMIISTYGFSLPKSNPEYSSSCKTYYKFVNLGIGPIIHLGRGFIAIIGKLEYSRSMISVDNKTYLEGNSLNFVPSLKLQQPIIPIRRSSSSFNLHLTIEGNYGISIKDYNGKGSTHKTLLFGLQTYF